MESTASRVLPSKWIALTCLVALTIIGVATFGTGSPAFGDLMKRYQPRELCMLYDPAVIWLHLVADACIALAYYSIPLALIYFVRRRGDPSFKGILICFAVFILACGTTHVMNIVALWYAPYRLDGLVKLFTAVVSVATAAMLWPLIPKALAIPSPNALRAANADLAREVEVRRRAEASLVTVQTELEARFEERTRELSEAYTLLEIEVAARASIELEREALLLRERQARAEAERANRIKDDFLATLSHELRTPIGAILNWTELLRADLAPDAQHVEALEIIERNAHAQVALVNDLLDTSRIISGKLRLEIKPLNLATVAKVAVETVRLQANQRGVELVFTDALTQPCLIQGDADRLQQVIWNLLTNAVKFTPRGGRVTVSLNTNDSTAVIEVTDTGTGIAADFLPHLFERFRQADSSTTRRHGGLGLGLAIVQEITHLHGGTIEAHSEGLGRGSRFTLSLPLKGSPVVTVPSPAKTSPSQSGSLRLDGLAILLVDDEPDWRESLRRLLEMRGARVTTADSAAAALALLEKQKPDLLVSDIGMPDEDGYSLIRRVRQLPPEVGGKVRAVALTAFARDEDRSRSIEAGFQAHLGKPIEAEQLVAVLHVLQRRPETESAPTRGKSGRTGSSPTV